MQKHGGNPPQHPKDDCEPDSAGFQHRVPELSWTWAHLYARFWAGGAEFKWMSEGWVGLTDLYVLSERVEDLFGYFHCFGEVLLPMGVNYILPWVVPVEVTDWLLKLQKCRQNILLVSFWTSNAIKRGRGQPQKISWCIVGVYLPALVADSPQ